MPRTKGTGGVYPVKNRQGEVCKDLYKLVWWEKRLDGTKKQRTRRFHGTKPQAERKMREIQTSIDQGTYVPSAKMTLGDHLDAWLKRHKKNLSHRGYVQYESIIRVHLKPGLGRVVLEHLTTERILDFYATREERLSSSRLRLMHTVLSLALTAAVRLKKIVRNPCSKDYMDPPKRYKSTVGKPMTPEQARALLDHQRGKNLYLPIYLSLHTGMRLGEILALKWENVDEAERVIHVAWTLYDIKEEPLWDLKVPKSENVRSIDVTEEVMAELRRHRGRQAERRLQTKDYRDQGFVYTYKNGDPRGLNRTSAYFYKMMHRSGLPIIRFHDLRHTFATILGNSGVEANALKEMMGHHDVAFTLETYAKVFRTRKQAAAEVITGELREGKSQRG
jgi:integrase